MVARDPIAVCTELKEAGALPEAVGAVAKDQGLDRLATIRLLRSLFGLTLAGAKEVLIRVDGPATAELPGIETREQLLQVLSIELGYCDCASAEALQLLARFLRAARERSDYSNDAVKFGSASRELEACTGSSSAASSRTIFASPTPGSRTRVDGCWRRSSASSGSKRSIGREITACHHDGAAAHFD